MTRPWKGLRGTWLSPKAAEDPSGSVASRSPAASRSVCPSLGSSEDGQPRAACRDRDLDPAPRHWEPGGHGGWGSWHPGGDARGSPGAIRRVAGGTVCVSLYIV